jgi:D-glutamate N-acetyltransferase
MPTFAVSRAQLPPESDVLYDRSDKKRESGAEAGTDAGPAGRLDLPTPYLLFLGDTIEPGYAKTAFGLRDWAGDKCVGEFTLPGATVTTGLPQMVPAEAVAAGAGALVIGVANSGGVISPGWIPALLDALDAGLDIVSGMHNRLVDHPLLREKAVRLGRRLIDIRVPPPGLPIATGRKRSGKRLLTVGTDCALGKKYSALAIARALHGRGLAADFRATGQTGIMIAGGGIAIDAVVADFAAGAAELLSPDADPEHWDVIEGQGSLGHPAYAGVSLALLHGSQPDVITVCHDPSRAALLGHPAFPLPGVEEVIALSLELGRRTNPEIRCAGVTVNTSRLDADEAAALLDREAARLGLPVADPVRGGARFERLIDACLG